MELSVKDKRIKYWLSQAKEDFKTARIMLFTRRWKYSIFMCQQSIEKFLKAIYMTKNENFPPRIHNLFRLAELIDKKLFPDEFLEFFSELSLFYLSSRYPEDINKMEEINNKEAARKIFKKTEDVFKWLSKIQF